jgi:hypothetical protein
MEEVGIIEIRPEDLTEEQKQYALVFYAKQLTKLRQYNKIHRDEINEKNKASFKKMKENPEKYEEYKRKKREEYKRKKEINKTN